MWIGDIRELHYPLRRQRQMYIKDRVRDIHGHGIDYEYLAIRGDSYQYHFEINRCPQRSNNSHSQTKEEKV